MRVRDPMHDKAEECQGAVIDSDGEGHTIAYMNSDGELCIDRCSSENGEFITDWEQGVKLAPSEVTGLIIWLLNRVVEVEVKDPEG